MRFSGWWKQRKLKERREIAKAVYDELSASRGWEKFLPPVVLRDTVYLVTESGSVYAMRQDSSGMELIMEIRRQ